jgi:hypothetical protein
VARRTQLSTPPRVWWRVALVVVVSVVCALGALGCGLAWLLMGFMGTAVEPWEPVAYPTGVVVCLAVPVLVGRSLLGARPAARQWAWAVGVVALVVAVVVAMSVLGVTTS